jgi:hypothetical protein
MLISYVLCYVAICCSGATLVVHFALAGPFRPPMVHAERPSLTAKFLNSASQNSYLALQ